MIDFSSINAFSKGQRESFEDLICVLARREKHEEAIEYQSHDGCGGDGGVEAIWILGNGRKIGYQAKFFLSLDDSQWKQMDKSVKQALKVHPELQTYVFALPKDLTPERGAKGKSQREKWNDRVEKWQSWAAAGSINIDFKIWSETDLREILLREESTALVKYWFAGDVLNSDWFQRQVNVGVRALEDRFNPDDHVEVAVEALFDTLARGPQITDLLTNGFSELMRAPVPKIEFSSIELKPDVDALFQLNKAWDELVEFKEAFQHDFDKKWDTNSITKVIESLHKALWALERKYISIDKMELSEESDKLKLDSVLASLHNISSVSNSLKDTLCHPNLEAEVTRCAVLYGPAGAGKSHILGQVAEKRVSAGLPTVLLLGQSFSNSAFWEQLGALLGLEGRTVNDVLGVLNTAGERVGERTLLLFDAINEGVGSLYWKQNLTEFVHAIAEYPYLAAVFSFREEYLPYAFPASLITTLPKFRISGFSTLEEQEQAAICYLDRKGIARPNTPFLSPEFSNPLFLKSVSEALYAKGLKEFPRGLNGISQVMVLYLDALSWRTGVETTISSDISKSITQCVRLFASQMAEDACDYVVLEHATALAERSFKGRTPPEGKTWLEVLIQTSLFRRDPPPYSKDVDPFDPPSELVRFSFQRFQDHLMATALVNKITIDRANIAFDENGPLNFLFYSGKLTDGIRYKYAGLISALSTVYPEKLKLEFAKTLPNWKQHWQEGELLQTGFGESFKWRSSDAFSDATRELFNLLDDRCIEPFGLLLDVSMMADHPFNALRLHKYLQQFSMPERDSQWTTWINWASREEFSQIDRVVSWALAVSRSVADAKHMELASLVLVWSLSSSHMTLRDRASKGLTSLFLSNLEVFIYVLDKMYDCDDPYIIERIYAAAFGACCIDQSSERLARYSTITYEKVFVNRKPPVALLTRDYALGIIELANSKKVTNHNLDSCYPPFESVAPTFTLTKEDVEAVAETSGGEHILRSASSEWGDFGKYSIPGRVNSFLDTTLDQPAPKSREQYKLLFLDEVINPYEERVRALAEFEKSSEASSFAELMRIIPSENEEIPYDLVDLEVKKGQALSRLTSLLLKREKDRLKAEYFGAEGHVQFKNIDVQQCRFWITKRAYDLGWSTKLFPRDNNRTGYSRHENDLERIGKKYQRIALDELQARLSDNYWVLQGWPEKPCVYRHSHHDFRRNFEPTILPDEKIQMLKSNEEHTWITKPDIKLLAVNEEHIKQWPFDKNPTENMGEKLLRRDREGNTWLVLYDFNIDTQKYDDSCSGEHGMRYEEFRFFYCAFIKRGKANELASFLKSIQNIETHSFEPVEFSGPYFREAPWRETWLFDKDFRALQGAPDGCEFVKPLASYYWESHLDKSLPDGFASYMPQKWFADELKISLSSKHPYRWLDSSGEIIIQEGRSSVDNKAVIIDENTLNSYACEFDVEPVWLMIAERNHWPNGSNSGFCGRRAEGMAWQEDGHWNQVQWHQDTKG